MKTSIFIFFLLLPFIASYAQTNENKVYSQTVCLGSSGNRTRDTSLLAEILSGIRARKIIAYSDSAFKKPMSVADVNNIVNAKSFLDTLFYEHTSNGDEVIQIIQRDFDFFGIRDYKILARGRSDVHYIGIGIDRRTGIGGHSEQFGDPEPFPPTRTLFWIKYSQVSAIIDRYNASHPHNQLTLH